MLNSVWNAFVPGVRKLQSHLSQTQQVQPEAADSPTTVRPALQRSAETQENASSHSKSTETLACTCSSAESSHIGGSRGCSSPTCIYALKERKPIGKGGDTLLLGNKEHSEQQRQSQTSSADKDLHSSPALGSLTVSRAVSGCALDEGERLHSTTGESAYVISPSCQQCTADKEKVPEETSQRSKENPGVVPQNELEVQEGWENIFGDEAERTAEVSLPVGSLAEALLFDRDSAKISDKDAQSREADGSVVCSSPPTEFEYVPDSALRDARRLLRLSQRQQLRGWGWAYAGFASALEGRMSTCRAASGNSSALESFHPVNGDEHGSQAEATDADGSSSVLSGFLHLREGSKRRASSLEPACASRGCQGRAESAPRAPLVLSGWRGRWQLTSLDSPRGSVSSYCSAETKRNSPTPRELSNCVTLLGKVPAQLSAEEGFAVSVAQIPESSCSCEDAPVSAISAPTHDAADSLKEQLYASEPCVGELAVESESAGVPAKSSSPPENGHPEDSTAKRLQDLLLHRAQRQLESECRRRVQGKDWRLNILVTALPGIDASSFSQQMFAEWQQVARQETACGEEYIFRFQSAVPFVEVSVVAMSTFASALPYCELRLLEKCGDDTSAREETSERRVLFVLRLPVVESFGAYASSSVDEIHVCLFLVPYNAVPLPAIFLALLKRLRAVACLLPLLVVQQSISPEQLATAKNSLRLQLAGSDLATMEEMLLPVPRMSDGPESVAGVCSHCQQSHMHEDRHDQDSQSQRSASTSKREDRRTKRCAGTRRTASLHFEAPSSDESKSSSSNISASDVDDNGENRGLGRSKRKASQGEGQGEVREDSPALTQRGRTNSISRRGSSNSGIDNGSCALYRGAVHLPLVLQLPSCSEGAETGSSCTCWSGSEGCSSVATPATLRQMLVDASAVLLRERAEYGCFLPFLFQHQLQEDQTSKLHGLQRWEEDVERQKRQRQHVEALIEVRQGQIDRSTAATRKVQLQKQLNDLRQQLQKMQQQLLQLQQQKFLRRLLKEEAEGVQAFSVHHGRLLLPCRSRQGDGKEEPVPHIAQMGLVLACVMGVGAILFTSIKNSSQ
ncbi:hypothetical protein Emed_003583 [Eimeria media]